MTIHAYLMPVTGAGTDADSRRPKYADTDLAGVTYSFMDGGNENVGLVVADVGGTTHSALVAHADVTAAPTDLTQEVGLSLTAVKNAIESLGIPAGWIDSTMDYMTVLRGVAAMLQFMQRLQNFAGGTKIYTGAITLDSAFSSLPPAMRNALKNAATSLGYDITSLTGASTIRQCLKAMGDQWSDINNTIAIGGLAF